jgi:crotonobetainyl-CoA:carnitine CoA-transferase CaiB-like acyl-CoA transferase
MNVSSNFLNGNMETTRIGNMHPSIVPYGVYRVKDQHMMLAAATNT